MTVAYLSAIASIPTTPAPGAAIQNLGPQLAAASLRGDSIASPAWFLNEAVQQGGGAYFLSIQNPDGSGSYGLESPAMMEQMLSGGMGQSSTEVAQALAAGTVSYGQFGPSDSSDPLGVALTVLMSQVDHRRKQSGASDPTATIADLAKQLDDLTAKKTKAYKQTAPTVTIIWVPPATATLSVSSSLSASASVTSPDGSTAALSIDSSVTASLNIWA